MMMQATSVKARCGKTSSSGYAEVTTIVVENSGAPSDCVDLTVSHEVSSIIRAKSSGIDATVRKRPRTCTSAVAAKAPRIKQIKKGQPTDDVMVEIIKPVARAATMTAILVHTGNAPKPFPARLFTGCDWVLTWDTLRESTLSIAQSLNYRPLSCRIDPPRNCQKFGLCHHLPC